MSVKLRPWLEEELRREFEERGESVSEGLRRVVEEWWAMRHLPGLEFRETLSGRRPAMKGGPEVWEIILASRDYEDDGEGLLAHFAWLAEKMLDSALAYYERFPDVVDEVIDENERTARHIAARMGDRIADG